MNRYVGETEIVASSELYSFFRLARQGVRDQLYGNQCQGEYCSYLTQSRQVRSPMMIVLECGRSFSIACERYQSENRQESGKHLYLIGERLVSWVGHWSGWKSHGPLWNSTETRSRQETRRHILVALFVVLNTSSSKSRTGYDIDWLFFLFKSLNDWAEHTRSFHCYRFFMFNTDQWSSTFCTSSSSFPRWFVFFFFFFFFLSIALFSRRVE